MVISGLFLDLVRETPPRTGLDKPLAAAFRERLMRNGSPKVNRLFGGPTGFSDSTSECSVT